MLTVKAKMSCSVCRISIICVKTALGLAAGAPRKEAVGKPIFSVMSYRDDVNDNDDGDSDGVALQRIH